MSIESAQRGALLWVVVKEMLRVLIVVAAVALVPAAGWWQLGHVLVAEIGFEGLTGMERSHANAIARGTGELFGFAPDMVESAVWMDDLKAMGFTAFNNWHFVDTPYLLPGSNVTPPPPQEANLTWALQQMRDAFRTSRASSGSRALALRALVHLVGDMGQPLHSVSLFSDAFPQGDGGGNGFRVTYNGMPTNLHSFFDSGAFRLNDTLSQPMTRVQLLRVSGLVTDIMTRYPRSSFDAKSLAFDPEQWAKDSLANAIQVVYLNGQLAPNSVLSEEYVSNAFALCERMIALSGYRLQTVLSGNVPNASLDSGPTWVVILVVSIVGAFTLGIVGGAFGYWVFQKRRKRIRYMSSIDRDSEDELMIAREV